MSLEDSIEQSIADKLTASFLESKDKRALRKEIEKEILTRAYLEEDWMTGYAVERIFSEIIRADDSQEQAFNSQYVELHDGCSVLLLRNISFWIDIIICTFISSFLIRNLHFQNDFLLIVVYFTIFLCCYVASLWYGITFAQLILKWKIIDSETLIRPSVPRLILRIITCLLLAFTPFGIFLCGLYSLSSGNMLLWEKVSRTKLVGVKSTIISRNKN